MDLIIGTLLVFLVLEAARLTPLVDRPYPLGQGYGGDHAEHHHRPEGVVVRREGGRARQDRHSQQPGADDSHREEKRREIAGQGAQRASALSPCSARCSTIRITNMIKDVPAER